MLLLTSELGGGGLKLKLLLLSMLLLLFLLDMDTAVTERRKVLDGHLNTDMYSEVTSIKYVQ